MHALNLFLFLLMLPGIVPAQSYSSVQYNTNDGLASSTVYCMIQDKDGFIWLGTGAGLCRFDGTHFKTFTTADGLPDNEILKMYQDTKGRIWMLPFKNAVCYYLNGSIHNQQNDSVLKKINITERLFNLFEDKAGTIWSNEADAIYKIYKNNKVERLEELGGVKLKNTYYFGNDQHDRIWFLSVDNNEFNIYKNENGRSFPVLKNYNLSGPNDFLISGSTIIRRPAADTYLVQSGKNPPANISWQFCRFANTFSFLNDSLISINTKSGSNLLNTRTGRAVATLVKGKSTSCVIQDREKNFWISTLDEGVFRVPSENFRNIDLPGMYLPGNHITSFDRVDSGLYILTSSPQIVQMKLPGLNIIRTKQLDYLPGKILALFRKNNKFTMIAINGIFQYDTAFNFIADYRPGVFAKDVVRNDNMLVIATSRNVIRFDIDKFTIADTVLDGRSTAVYVQNKTTYVGTLHGLYAVTAQQPPVFLGDVDPVFKNRIATLNQSADGSLWVGTTNDGLIRFRDGKILDRYTTANGLSSNNCITVLLDGNTIWLGTDKGLNKISIDDKGSKITRITHADGLSADQIIKLMLYGDSLFVCTSEGITYFNKTKLDQSSECALNVLDVSGSDKTLKISYVAISYKSAGDIVYRYRLRGIDKEWRTTRETSLEFVSLPYGQYSFELVAENKFGVQSNTVIIALEVPVPFWKTTLFYILAAALFFTLIYWLYKKRLRVIRQKEKEKTDLNKKMVEMELKALRAQMNPHFTFNVLNSIQYYIGYNNTAAAQSYLAKFSKLIRLTLDNSKNTFITLHEEQRLLKLYLDLEKMRFEDKFVYDIIIDPCINGETLIPNMLLQPFVENAIKHGFKKEIKDPKVEIRIVDHSDGIHCTITDNGVGRSKNGKPVGEEVHKQAGVAMIMEKTEVLRHYYNYKVFVEINDLYGRENEPCGTRVLIKFPKLTTIS